MSDNDFSQLSDPSAMVSGADMHVQNQKNTKSTVSKRTQGSKKKKDTVESFNKDPEEQNNKSKSTQGTKKRKDVVESDKEDSEEQSSQHKSKKQKEANENIKNGFNSKDLIPTPMRPPAPTIITDDGEYDPSDEFKVVVADPKTLAELFLIIGNVITEFPITVESSEHFSGITIECTDSGNICTVQAMLTASVMLSPESDGFVCLQAKQTISCLSSVSPSSYIQLIKKKDDQGLYCSSYEGNSIIEDVGFRLNVMDRDPDDRTLNDMHHEYNVAISLEILRKIMKNAKDLECDEIEFTVLEPRGQDDLLSDNNYGNSQKHVFVRIDVSGQVASIFKMLHSVTERQESAQGQEYYTSRTVEADDTITPEIVASLEQKYNAKFAYEFLSKFIKSMAKQTLTIHLGQGVPMILEYSLGDEKSYIKFALAPKAIDVL